ncbi:MAG TPA: AAA family ATPase [Candidatus Dormibacteraeota bacterium]
MVAVRALCPILVGREAELTELEDALLAAARGEGRMVLLSADAGMGKTRLGLELAERAIRMGMSAFTGVCSDSALALPYLPFLEALGNYVARSEVDSLRRRLGSSIDELGLLFPRLGRAPRDAGDPAHAKLRFFEAILQLLEVAAGESGLLLVLEDLQGADDSTRELLDYIARRLESSRILVLGTYRADELSRKHPLLSGIEAWQRNGLAQVIELKPLEQQEVEGMIEAIFDEPSSSDTGRFLHERCEGNPFVLEELLKESVDRGDIFRTEHGWQRKELRDFSLPRTVREAILLRLERLGPDNLRMLRAASVLGDPFEEKALIAVAGEDQPVVQEALRACMQQQLLREQPGSAGVYHFRHSLTRDAVYEDLVSTERQEYHARAASTLRVQPGAQAVEIARHLIAAGQTQEAVPMCLEAAGQAESTWAMTDAADLYEKALPHIGDSLLRAETLERLGRCLRYASRPGAAGASESRLEESVRLFDAADRPRDAARVRVALALAYYPRLRHARAVKELEIAISVLEPHGPSADLAEAYNHLAFFRIIEIDGKGCAEWAERALTVAEAAGAGMAQVRAQSLLGSGLACEGRADEAIEWHDRSAEVAIAKNWSWAALSAMNNVLLYLPLERWGEVPHRLERMRHLDAHHFSTTNCEAMLAVARGFPAKAAAIAEAARRASESREWAMSVFWTRCTLVHAYAGLGRIEEAREALPPADASSDKQDQLSRWGAELQLVQVSGGDGAAVLAAMPVERLVRDWPWAVERVLAMQALVELGAVDRVEEELRGAPDTGFFRALRIDVARARGRYSEILDSAPKFIELASRVGAWRFANRALLALAEAAARSGTKESAPMLLQQVMSSALEREDWRQQQETRRLAQDLGIELQEHQLPAAALQPTATGERFVTVLFADIRGYTELSHSTAPAVMADKIASLQRSAAREVARHHGTVDKFAGDAVMATFNVTGASIDHANHALLAAMAMRDRARYMGIALGIGIATGPAIVGRLSKNANLSVLGETTNLASRLQAQAGPNQIVLSEEAWKRLRDRVDAHLEMLELKGFAEPVPAYRVG